MFFLFNGLNGKLTLFMFFLKWGIPVYKYKVSEDRGLLGQSPKFQTISCLNVVITVTGSSRMDSYN